MRKLLSLLVLAVISLSFTASSAMACGHGGKKAAHHHAARHHKHR